MQVKQRPKIKYSGCMLNETMSQEAMALFVINKINDKLKFLHWKTGFFIDVPISFKTASSSASENVAKTLIGLNFDLSFFLKVPLLCGETNFNIVCKKAFR